MHKVRLFLMAIALVLLLPSAAFAADDHGIYQKAWVTTAFPDFKNLGSVRGVSDTYFGDGMLGKFRIDVQFDMSLWNFDDGEPGNPFLNYATLLANYPIDIGDSTVFSIHGGPIFDVNDFSTFSVTAGRFLGDFTSGFVGFRMIVDGDKHILRYTEFDGMLKVHRWGNGEYAAITVGVGSGRIGDDWTDRTTIPMAGFEAYWNLY